MTTDRSFEGINPVAGNVKNTELQRAGPQVVSERKRRGEAQGGASDRAAPVGERTADADNFL